MKKGKSFLTVVGLACVMLPSVFFMTACSCGNDEPTTPHTHNFSQTWTYDDDNHFHKCEGEGCNEISDNAVHNHSIVSAGNETQHKLSCACGHYIYAPHTGGQATCQEKAVCEVCQTEYGDFAGHNHATEWSSDATHHWHACQTTGCEEKNGYVLHNHTNSYVLIDANQHKAYCECGHFINENHTHAYGIQDCACGKEVTNIEEIGLIQSLTTPYCNERESELITAQLNKYFAFQVRTVTDNWAYRALRITPYDTNNIAQLDNVIDTSKYAIHLFDENKQEISLGSNLTNGNCISNIIEANTVYYVVIEFLSLDDWANAEFNPGHDVCVKFEEFDNVSILGSGVSMNPVFKFITTNIESGSRLAGIPHVGVIGNVNSSVSQNNFSIKKLNTDGTLKTLTVTDNYNYYTYRFVSELEENSIYYLVFNYTANADRAFDFEELNIIANNSIATSTKSEPKTATISSPVTEKTYTFRYIINPVHKSKIKLAVQGPSDVENYTLNVFMISGNSMMIPVTFSYDNETDTWIYNAENVRANTLYISVALNVASSLTVSVCQVDTIMVTRVLNGGSLSGNTPVEVEYGKSYSSNYMQFGVPTLDDKDFKGWVLKNGESTSTAITGVSGAFGGVWSNSTLLDYDWHGNGEVTIYATWQNATRVVKLNPGTGGTWAGGTSGTISDITLTSNGTLGSEYIPIRAGYTFLGFYRSEARYVRMDGSTFRIDRLTNKTNNYYMLTAEWAKKINTTATISYSTVTEEYYDFTTGNWTLPTGQTTSGVRIEIAGVNPADYNLYVYNTGMARINGNQNVFNLAPGTQYFIKIVGHANASNKTLVITRDTGVGEFALEDNNFADGDKFVLKLHIEYSGSYRLLLSQGLSKISDSSFSSVKMYDSDMSNPINLTQSTQGEYSLEGLNRTVYYIEFVFNANRTNVDFTLTE